MGSPNNQSTRTGFSVPAPSPSAPPLSEELLSGPLSGIVQIRDEQLKYRADKEQQARFEQALRNKSPQTQSEPKPTQDSPSAPPQRSTEAARMAGSYFSNPPSLMYIQKDPFQEISDFEAREMAKIIDRERRNSYRPQMTSRGRRFR
jgi:hypothetical protein